MRIRHLIALLLTIGFGTTGALAASWTVHPIMQHYCTGTTDYAVKTEGEVLVHGGPTTGSVRQNCGWFKFDLASIPDDTVFTKVEFNFYVNDTYHPYFSITPMTYDPVLAGSHADLLWDDIQEEKLAGFYNQQLEPWWYTTGWKRLELGGTAVADVSAALLDDWFAFGVANRDEDLEYYVEIDGVTNPNPPYLVVINPSDPPSDLTCVENGLDVDLTWVNNGPYDTIGVYDNNVLMDTLPGTATSCSLPIVTGGDHCYQVCDLSDPDPVCSTECCLNLGSCTEYMVDLGSMGCSDTITATGDITGAGRYCRNESGDHFYSITLTEAGQYTFTTCSEDTDFDTYLRLYSDTCCGSQLAWNDQAENCFHNPNASTIEDLPLDAGTYYLQVEGYFNHEGPYELIIACTPLPQTIDCAYQVTPTSGTLPLVTSHWIQMTNTLEGGVAWSRRVAGRINLRLANGSWYPNWRSGYTVIRPGNSFTRFFNLNLPAVGSLVGSNTWTLVTEDVTPPPYNQPPYPPAGYTCTAENVVVGFAP